MLFQQFLLFIVDAIYSALEKVGGESLNIVVSKVVGLHLVGQQLHLIMLELPKQTWFNMRKQGHQKGLENPFVCLKKIKSRHRMRNFEGSPFQINNPNILYI
jgi:hypothetical protein